MLTTSTLSNEHTTSFADDLRGIAGDLWRSRGLLFELTRRDIRVRYKQAVMGIAWAIVMPLVIVASGVVLRVVLLNMSGTPVEGESIGGVVVKGLGWSFVASAIGFSTNVLTLNAGLIAKIYFPRETLPLSVVLASTLDTAIAAAAVLALLPFLGWHPTWTVLWAPVLAACLFAFTFALGLLVSCGNLFFRDVKYLVQLCINFGVFFTPVFYEPHALGARWIPIQMMNPLSPLLEGLRLSVLQGHNLLLPLRHPVDGSLLWSPYYLLASATTTLVALIAGAVIFHRAQYRFVENL